MILQISSFIFEHTFPIGYFKLRACLNPPILAIASLCSRGSKFCSYRLKIDSHGSRFKHDVLQLFSFLPHKGRLSVFLSCENGEFLTKILLASEFNTSKL